MNKLYKNYVFDLIVAAVALALGVVMLPVFGISAVFIDILLAAALVAYLILFLLDKLKHTRGVVFALTVIEFALLALATLGHIVQQFTPLHFTTVCQAVGVVLCLRGCVMATTMYVSALSLRKPRSELITFAIAILMIVVGTALFSGSFIDDYFLEWVMCIALFITALAFAALAFLFYHPKKKD